MVKFTFPVSARWSKQPTAPSTSTPNTTPVAASAPPALSKAHKILGGVDGGGPILATAYRQRDVANRPTISAHAPENAASIARSDRARLGDDGTPESGRAAWDAESDTVPPHVRKGGLDPLATRTTAADLDPDQSDDSEMRHRRPSNASLNEWYDKSKLPLSISQQTSASAMAKGPPLKASAILDIDNGSPLPPPSLPGKLRKKKKPHGLDFSGLDFSALLSRKKGKLTGEGRRASEPESSSASPAPVRQGRHWRKHDSGKSPQQAARPRTVESERRRRPGETAPIDRMYRHYEAMTHRDNPEEEDAVPPIPPIPDSVRVVIDSSPTRPAPPPESSASSIPPPPTSQASLQPSDVASISSRQTRESKRTARSKFEPDLQLTSVLSLSSSSGSSEDENEEDDQMADGVEAFLLEASRGVTPVMGPITNGRSYIVPVANHDERPTELPGGLVPSDLSARAKRESYASTDTYLTVPSQTASKKSKSTSPSSQGSPWAAQGQSRLSMMSTSTLASTASWASSPRRAYPAPPQSPPSAALPKPPQRSNSKRRDDRRLSSFNSVACFSRQISTKSAASIRTSQSYSQLSPISPVSPLTFDDVSRSGPPLTPAAIDDFLRSASISRPSAREPTAPPSAVSESPADDDDDDGEPRPNPDHHDVDSLHNPRFMAVTRQEELLLATLRQKRALMRQSSHEHPSSQEVVDSVSDENQSPKGSRQSDSRASHASTTRHGAASRASTRTITEMSFAGNMQPRDSPEATYGEIYDGGRKQGSASTHSQPSSQRSSATVSRVSAASSPSSTERSSSRTQTVPLFLDESSVPEYHRVSNRDSQSSSRPRLPPLSASRSSSRAQLHPHMEERVSRVGTPAFEISDDQFDAYEDQDDDGAESERSEGDAAFVFPVPGGRGSISIGIGPASSSRSNTVRKPPDMHRRTNQRSLVASPSFTTAMPLGRRGAIHEAVKSAIPEDEVHNVTSDELWSPISSLPPPPSSSSDWGRRLQSADVPRPDSPPLAPDEIPRKKKRAARLSAVGGRSGEPGWWGHDG